MAKFIQLPGTSLHFQSIGKGRPVLFLHGFTADHRLMKGCFEPIFKKKAGWRRLYLDLPGMGHSKSTRIKNADDMLAVLVEFIEKAIPNENFSVVGESYGGYLAQGLLHRFSERIDGLLLVCPVIHSDPQKRNLPSFRVRTRDDAFMKKVKSAAKSEFESMTAIQTRQTWKAFEKDILPGIDLHDRKFCTEYFKSGYGFRSPASLRPFEGPVLVVTGRQDSVVGFRDASEWSEAYPLATYAVLDGAGHNLQIESPRLFSALVDDWVDRVKAAIA